MSRDGLGNKDSGNTSGILVIDASGQIFALVRSLKLGRPVLCAPGLDHVTPANMALVIVATYGRVDWRLVSRLTERTTTMLIATRSSTDDACHAITTGAFGYVDAGLPHDALRRAIRGVLAGEICYSRRVLATMIRNRPWLRSAGSLPLTPRQIEVVRLIARGAGDKEIARTLGIAPATAQKHVTNLLKRLDVPNRAAAVAAVTAMSCL